MHPEPSQECQDLDMIILFSMLNGPSKSHYILPSIRKVFFIPDANFFYLSLQTFKQLKNPSESSKMMLEFIIVLKSGCYENKENQWHNFLVLFSSSFYMNWFGYFSSESTQLWLRGKHISATTSSEKSWKADRLTSYK